jgi:hypothetical protein
MGEYLSGQRAIAHGLARAELKVELYESGERKPKE